MGSSISTIIMFVVLIALMYFMMIKPQKKQQKQQQELMDSIEKGDYVLTTSGFYGVIIDITDDDVIVEFDCDGVYLDFSRNAIARVTKKAAAEPAAEEAPSEEEKTEAEDK